MNIENYDKTIVSLIKIRKSINAIFWVTGLLAIVVALGFSIAHFTVIRSKILARENQRLNQTTVDVEKVLQATSEYTKRIRLMAERNYTHLPLLDTNQFQRAMQFYPSKNGYILDNIPDSLCTSYGMLGIRNDRLNDLHSIDLNIATEMLPMMADNFKLNNFILNQCFFSADSSYATNFPWYSLSQIEKIYNVEGKGTDTALACGVKLMNSVWKRFQVDRTDREGTWSGFYFDTFDNLVKFSYFLPIYDHNRYTGMYTTEINTKLLATSLDKYKSTIGTIAVIDTDGVVLLSSDTTIQTGTKHPFLSQKLISSCTNLKNFQAENHIWSSQKLNPTPWYCILSVSKSSLTYETFVKLTGTLITSLFWIVFILSILMFVYKQVISRLIKTVADQTDELHLVNIQRNESIIELNSLKNTLIEQIESQAAHLVEAEKRASVGTLAAGVAHEIGNPVHFMLINTRVLQKGWEVLEPLIETLPDESRKIGTVSAKSLIQEIPDLLDEMVNGCHRIERIVNDLKEYAQPCKEEFVTVDLNDVVTQSLRLSRAFITTYTDNLLLQISEKPVFVHGNIHQLEQVLINLLQNSCRALSSKDQSIQIVTTMDPHPTFRVIDTGCGMSESTLASIGDPFFTTNRSNGGTGLGVSIAHRIVTAHGGTITYQSTIGLGTVATVEFHSRIKNNELQLFKTQSTG